MRQMHVVFFFLHKIINGYEIGTATVNYSDSIEEWMSHQFTTFFHSRHVHRQKKKCRAHSAASRGKEKLCQTEIDKQQ